MNSFRKSIVLIIAAFALALGSCSDDGSTPTDGTGGTTDTDPPAVASVTPVDGFHLDVVFDEDVLKESAEREQNYTIVERVLASTPGMDEVGTVSPGDTLYITAVALKPDKRTISVSTGDAMDTLPYDISVSGVADLHGNKMTSANVRSFTGAGTADQTPPEIVYRSPVPGATQVGTGQSVIVQFSEPVFYGSVQDSLSWTFMGGSVLYDLESEYEITFVITPLQSLNTGTLYTITLDGVRDWAGNAMAATSWSFTTTTTVDNTPPTFESSSPANMARNVNVNALLSLTFSEAIDQTHFGVAISPNPGEGVAVWSMGGRTVTFDPDEPLLDDTQYNLIILPGDVRDLAGNGIADPVNILFTTAPNFATGGFSGTISGDPTSDFADDPTGAIVIAADMPPFDVDDFNILGSDIVADDDTYTIANLPDGFYYPISAMDTNDDGNIDPDEGDAIGAFGVADVTGDLDMDSVVVSGGSTVADVDFQLFDPSAIVGTFSYDGAHSGGEYYAYVGVFDTVGFDPTGEPDFGTREYWPYNVEWRINSFDDGLDDGVYFIGAFLDLNGNELYDPGTEPAGIYGGVTPIPVVIEGGSDALGVHIAMEDTAGRLGAPPISWWTPRANRTPWFERLSAAIRRASATARQPH